MPPEIETPAPPSSEPQAGDHNAQTEPNAPNPATTAPEPPAPKSLLETSEVFESGSGVPSWAVGKTPREILATASDLYGALQRGESVSNDPPPTPASTPSPDVSTDIDPNLMYSNPAEYTRQFRESLRAEMRQEIQNAAGSVTAPLGALARSEAARNARYKAAWERWAPEIDLIMQRVPEPRRGDVALWNEAARMVQGEHSEEIAEARARELIAASGDAGMLSTQGAPSGTAGASSTRSPLQRLFDEDHPAIKGFKADGIPVSKVIAHARTMGHTEEAYADLLTKRAARVPSHT